MSVVQQDLTASEQSISKAIAQAWLSGVPEGTMIGDMPLQIGRASCRERV